jgi:anti-anti-sigma factor
MSQVEFIDSTGLGAILSLLRHVRARGAELRLCSVQPRVMAMFELVRMQKIVPLSRTQNEAAAAFTLSKAA